MENIFNAIKDSEDPSLAAYEFTERRYKEMESGVNKKFQANAHNTRIAEQLTQSFEPFKQELDLAGQDELSAIKQMAATHRMLRENPVEGMLKVMSHYGVDARSAMGAIQKASGIDPIDIETEETNPQMQAVLSNLDSMQTQLKQMRGTQTTVSEEQIASHVKTFSEDKDSEGNLTHPRFDELSDAMAIEINAGTAKTIEEAYKRASMLNPPEKKMVRKSVKQAKKAAKGVKSSAGDNGSTPRTLRQELEAQFEKMG